MDKTITLDSTQKHLISCDKTAEHVVIPYGVVNIGIDAFLECNHLKTVVIPNTVTTIGNSAFESCIYEA